MAEKHGNQPEVVVALARERGDSERLERSSAEQASKAIATGKDRNIEREAVVGERAILADALRHGMGTVLTADARAEFERSIAAGELIEVAQKPGRAGRVFTTPEMQRYETNILQHMGQGIDRYEALAPGSTSALTKNNPVVFD